MKKSIKLTTIIALSALTILGITGCGKTKTDTIKVSVTSVPHAEIFEHIKPTLEEKGVKIDLVVADDYNIHNRSLDEKQIDANFFQHFPFLEEQIADFGYDIQEFGKIHIEPLGVYSKNPAYASLDGLPDGATVSIPNDPSNEARALALLHRNGLIELEDVNDLKSNVLNIKENPRNLKFQEIDAAMLARTLDEVDIAVINTNFALAADLNPTDDALVIEDADSPYVNILTIRNGDEDRKELQILQEVLTSDVVRDFINEKYQGAIVPVF